jgi:hypothetical protein
LTAKSFGTETFHIGRARAWTAYLAAVESIESETVGRVGVFSIQPLSSTSQNCLAFWAAGSLEESARLRLLGYSSRAHELLLEIERVASARGYLRPKGRALWHLGLLVEEAGDLGKSVDYYTSRLLKK